MKITLANSKVEYIVIEATELCSTEEVDEFVRQIYCASETIWPSSEEEIDIRVEDMANSLAVNGEGDGLPSFLKPKETEKDVRPKRSHQKKKPSGPTMPGDPTMPM